GLNVDYKSATGTSWSTRATVPANTQLAAWHEFVFASLQTADAKLTAGLAQAGGNIRLVAADKTIYNQLAWGTGDSPLRNAVAAPTTNEQITRQPVGTGPQLQDTGNNQADFIDQPIEPASGGTTSTTGATSSGVTSTSTVNNQASSLDLQLMELLPDPVSPQ